jgi:lipoprotein NlpI
MKTAITILLSGLLLCGCSQKQASSTTKSTANERQVTLHQKFVQRTAQDEGKITTEQLRDADQLYATANKEIGTPDAKTSLQKMIETYPGINRTGCAMLILALISQGADQAKYLQESIDKYSDCFYGDGVQVGAYARFCLAKYYMSTGETEKAKVLFDEIKAKYPDAIDHHGELLVDRIKS